MKMIFILSMLLCNGIINADAQFDSLLNKTTLTYLFSREKVKYNEQGMRITTLKVKSTIKIVVDTIIQLSGNDRKLIAFSKCLNSIVLNESASIVKGTTLSPDLIDQIIGEPLIDGVKDNSKESATIIYQIGKAIYLITVPKDFFSKRLRLGLFVKKLDDLLLKTNTNPLGNGLYDLDSYFLFDSIYFPLHKFLIIQSDKENIKLIPGKNDYLSGFIIFEKAISNPELDFNTEADEYASYYKGEKWKRIYWSKKFGIITSQSKAYDKQKEYSYINTLRLQKVEFSKKP